MMTLGEKRWQRLFNGCPGAWMGNHDEATATGAIVVESDKAPEALDYLRRHRCKPYTIRASRWDDALHIEFQAH